MNFAITESERDAALLLHSLKSEDKEWILGKLPDNDAKILKELLSELSDLGVTADANVMDSITEWKKKFVNFETASDSVSHIQEERLSFLDKATANDLFCVLQDESAELIALFLNSHTWSWKSDFLSLLNSDMQKRIRECVTPNYGNPIALPSNHLNSLQNHLLREVEKAIHNARQDNFQSIPKVYKANSIARIKRLLKFIFYSRTIGMKSHDEILKGFRA